ncbi:unnamed protein product [Heterobilharzia americana]|nr:unnamed protein product [Heterobilharzia americana]
MNTFSVGALFFCLLLVEISSTPNNRTPNNPPAKPAPAKPAPAKPAPAKPVMWITHPPQESESFFKRMWNKVTSYFKSSESSSEGKGNQTGVHKEETTNSSLSFKDRMINKFNSWFGVEEYNPPKDSEFTDRLWLLFKHCFLNLKNLGKIISI